MFNVGQRTAVAGAFKLAGYEGPLEIAASISGDERAFLLERQAYQALRHPGVLAQVLQQLLGCKVFVAERTEAWGGVVPFE